MYVLNVILGISHKHQAPVKSFLSVVHWLTQQATVPDAIKDFIWALTVNAPNFQLTVLQPMYLEIVLCAVQDSNSTLPQVIVCNYQQIVP